MPSPIRQDKEEKELKGTLRDSREQQNTLEVESLTSIPTAPDGLPEAGKHEWYRVISPLQSQGILSVLDLAQIKCYCYFIATMEEAMVEMAKPNGKVEKLKSATGGSYYVKSPWVGIYNDAAANAGRIAKEFGFTPLSRKNIPAPKKKKEGKLLKLMGK